MYGGLLSIFIAVFVTTWVSPLSVWPEEPIPERAKIIGKPNGLSVRDQSDDGLRKTLEESEIDLEIARNSGECQREAAIITEMANIHENLLQFPEALERYNKALAIYRGLGDGASEALISINIARIHKKRGPLESALDFFEKALDIQRKLGDAQDEASTLLELADVYRILDQPWRQRQCYEEVLEIRKKTHDVKGQAAVLNSMGVCAYETVLAFQRKIADRAGEAITLNNIALQRLNEGQYRSAQEFCEKGLAIQKETKDSLTHAMLLRTKALISQRLGLHEEAIELCNVSLSGFRQANDIMGEIESLNAAADICSSHRDYGKALEFYEQAMDLVRRTGDEIAETDILKSIASIYAKDGKLEKALQLYEGALAAKKKLGAPIEVVTEAIAELKMAAGASEKTGQLLGDKKEPDIASPRYGLKSSRFQRALSKLSTEKLPNIETRFADETLRGLSYEGLDKWQDAIESFKTSIDMLEQVRDSLPEAQRKAFFNVNILGVPRMTPYEGLCRIFQKMGKPYEAFRYAEMSKARAFADSLIGRLVGVRSDAPENVIDEATEINSKLAEMIRVQTSRNGAFDPDALREVRKRRDVHIKKVRQMYPLFAATRFPEPMDLVETALTDDEWALEYQVTETGVVTFLIHGKTIRKNIFKAIPKEELDELVRKFREPLEIVPGKDLLGPKLEAFDFVIGKRLSNLLLGDILQILPAKVPVIVVPDDCLGLLPFEMLVLNDSGKISTNNPKIPCTSNAEFFGDRNPISYYQSITALTLLRYLGNRKEAGTRLLAVTDPIYDSNDVRLARNPAPDGAVASKDSPASIPFVIMAAQSKLSLHRLDATARLGKSLKELDPDRTDVFEGAKASKPLLLSSDLTPYRSIVFATHGYAGTDLPGILEPALVLTLVDQPKERDGFLRMSEVMGLRLNAGLVALIACKTGVGKGVSGEGTMFMGRAFQQAGAQSVLISLWSVAPEPSVRLMEGFFKNMKAGHGKLEALRLARTEVRQAGYDHPFFWAAFILVGGIQ